MKTAIQTLLLLGLVLVAGWVGTGCKTPESSNNEAERPWNAPRQWETGLPGFQPERR